MTTAATTRAFLVLAFLPGCMSLDRHVTIGAHDRVVVELLQPPGGKSSPIQHELRQTLRSEPELDRTEYYSSRASDPLAKLLTVEKMQLLLDVFATAGFFEHASERELTLGSSKLTVKLNDRTLVWARDPGMDDATRRDFVQCWQSFLELYNATPAYRTGLGSDTVQQQHQRQRQARGADR